MSIEVVGVDATLAELFRSVDVFKVEINEDIQIAGQECQGIAMDLAAVDTGEMRDATKYVPGEMECYVTNDSDHSIYLELGTQRQRPQPFMFPAFEIAKSHLVDRLGK